MTILKETTISGYRFSTDKGLLDRDYIHHFISTQSYWAIGVPKSIVDQSIDNALCFGVYLHEKQIGFARLITDYATFAYLADVFIDEAHRGKGLSKKLMGFIFGLPALQSLRRIMLGTRDAHSLYHQFGFKPLASPDRFMEIHRPDVYAVE
jgi:GNAT superfamily N-acetyltransferase